MTDERRRPAEWRVIRGDALEVLPALPAGFAQISFPPSGLPRPAGAAVTFATCALPPAPVLRSDRGCLAVAWVVDLVVAWVVDSPVARRLRGSPAIADGRGDSAPAATPTSLCDLEFGT